jgi:hypothetical protein
MDYELNIGSGKVVRDEREDPNGEHEGDHEGEHEEE